MNEMQKNWLTLFNKSNHPYNQRLKKYKIYSNYKIDISSINVLYPEIGSREH